MSPWVLGGWDVRGGAWRVVLDGGREAFRWTEAPGQQLGPEPMAPMIHGQRAIQAGMDVDAGPGIAAAPGAGVQLEQAAVELNGVIVADRALVLEAADALEVRRGRQPGGLGMGGRLREARIVPGKKQIDHALRVGERPSRREAQFADEAILEGAKEALDPPATLRRGGGDPADAEFLERPADLG